MYQYFIISIITTFITKDSDDGRKIDKDNFLTSCAHFCISAGKYLPQTPCDSAQD